MSAPLAWDRLLETFCNQHASELILTVGSSPLLRLPSEWRTLAVGSLEADALAAMVKALVADGAAPDPDGFIRITFAYGARATFQLIVRASTSPTFVLITKSAKATA